MIDEEKTFKKFGYYPSNLSYGSGKKVCAICDVCGKERLINFQNYRNLCIKCSANTKEHKKERSKMNKGQIPHNKGKKLSEKTKRKMSKSATGKKHTEDSKIKMSKAKKGVKKSKEHCINIGKGHKGIKHTEESKRNMSKGRKNPNITDEERQTKRKYPAYYEWRISIFERDNYMCQFCGLPIDLNAHHIESYNNNPELRIEVSNGITLCENCHMDFHHQYGYGNNTKEQLIEFINKYK